MQMDNTSWILKKYFLNKWQKTLRRKIRLYEIADVEEALKYKNRQDMTEFFTENFFIHTTIPRSYFLDSAITQDTS